MPDPATLKLHTVKHAFKDLSIRTVTRLLCYNDVLIYELCERVSVFILCVLCVKREAIQFINIHFKRH